MLFDSFKKYLVPKWVLLVTCLLLFVLVNSNYILFSFQILLGVCILPFLIQPKPQAIISWRYLVLACLFLVLALLFQLKVLLFVSWGCLLAFVIAYFWGTLGYLPLFFLLAISPALYYVVQIFSFPIRLEMSKYTCYVLNIAGMDLTYKGSYFVRANGVPFHIDQACVGLNMYGTGFIAATLIMAFREKQTGKHISFHFIVGSYFLMAALLLISNFVRICTLVMFHSLPNTLSHELIGIFSFVVYSLLPFYFLSRYVPVREVNKAAIIHKRPVMGLWFLLLVWLVASYGFGLIRDSHRKDILLEKLTITGYTKTPKEDGVMEFRNDSLLIYIKPAIRAFEGGHPPQICWKASGFDLCDFYERTNKDHSFMMGTLKKGDKYQYTAWWYDNGTTRTVHEWEWRKRNALPFRVINVIALDTNTLLQAVHSFQENSLVQTEPDSY